LGEQRLAVSSDDVLVTKRADGSLVIAAWNLTGIGEKGASRQIELQLRNSRANTVYVSRVDADHGDVHKSYEVMGSPRYPSPAQIEILRSAAKLPAAEIQHLSGGSLTLTIPPQGLVVIESEPIR
jgi:xylan 1,4-beta-xylosidase